MILEHVHSHPAFFATVFLQVLVLLVLSTSLGRLLRLRGLPAAGWGAYSLFAATYLTYEISIGFALPLALFPIATGSLLAIGVAVFRMTAASSPTSHSKISAAVVLSAILLTVPIIWIRTLNGFSPNASAQFFQAWDPLFVRESLANGRFLEIESMGFGEGFLTSALQYAPNARGLTTLLALARSPDVYASYVASGSFALIAGLCVLLDTLKRNNSAVALFTFLFLIFAACYQPFTNLIFGASSDELLFFAAALAAHSLFGDTEFRRSGRWAAAVAALALGVSGRNYGAFFAAGLLVPTFISAWRRSVPLRSQAAPLALSAVLVTPEIVRLCQATTLFYPRSRLPELFPHSLQNFSWGSLCDWGVLYERSAGSYAPSLIGLYILVVVLVSVQLTRMHRMDLLPSLAAPLLFLVLPMLLEAATGFRKDIAYSKIYFGSCWIFAWLPAYALLRLAAVPPVSGHRPPLVVARWLAVATAAGVAVTAVKGYGTGYYRILSAAEFQSKITRWWRADSSGIDESIARKALAVSGRNGSGSIVGRRVMYFHYEPGIGLRWYLGGNFFADLDYWSAAVQDRLDPEIGVEDFLNRFGRPILYLSRGTNPLYQALVIYPPRPKFWRELENWQSLTCFREAIEQDGALLLIPR